jgi:putative membrane protein
VDGSVAAASIVTEITVTLIAQYLFMGAGALCLLRLTGTGHLITLIVWGLALGLPALVVMVLLVRYGSVFERLERAIARLVGVPTLGLWGQPGALDAAIRRLWMEPLRLAATGGWQLAGLVVGSLENWLALRWLGHPVSLGAALVLESLTQAVRNFVFVVPAGVGVQEAGLVGVGYLLGLNSEVALALSLTKRLREILWGLPTLLCWQWFEGRRLARTLSASQ